MSDPRFVIGVDLGQASDWTAISIAERVLQFNRPRDCDHLDVRHVERIPLGTSYPAIVARVRELHTRLNTSCDVIVDASGVGRPVVDLFRDGGLRVIAATITAGDEARGETVRGGQDWRVPKRDLVTKLAVLLDTRRLRIAAALPFAQTLIDELLTFQTRTTASANETFGARSGAHDDLVLATALACWWSDRKRPRAQSFRLDFLSR